MTLTLPSDNSKFFCQNRLSAALLSLTSRPEALQDVAVALAAQNVPIELDTVSFTMNFPRLALIIRLDQNTY